MELRDQIAVAAKAADVLRLMLKSLTEWHHFVGSLLMRSEDQKRNMRLVEQLLDGIEHEFAHVSDGSLRQVPDGSKFVLGYRFVPFTENDWDVFAGADAGTLICYTSDKALLLSPSGGSIIEVGASGEETEWMALAERAR